MNSSFMQKGMSLVNDVEYLRLSNTLPSPRMRPYCYMEAHTGRAYGSLASADETQLAYVSSWGLKECVPGSSKNAFPGAQGMRSRGLKECVPGGSRNAFPGAQGMRSRVSKLRELKSHVLLPTNVIACPPSYQRHCLKSSFLPMS